MKKYCIKLTFLIIVIFALALSAIATPSQIEIISSSDDILHFVVTFDESSLDYYTNPDSQLVFAVPLQIAIPVDAQPQILSIIPGNYQQLSKTNINKSLAENKGLAKLSGVFSIRGIQTTNLILSPAFDNSFYNRFEIKLAYNSNSKNFGSITPGDRFENILKNTLINFDRIRKNSKTTSVINSAGTASASIFGNSTWYKIEVNQNGIYKINGADLTSAGISLNNLSSDMIHIYYGNGLPLEVLNERPRPEFEPVALLVDDGGDGAFDTNDHFLFYGESLNRWVYNLADGAKYYNNRYDDNNVYWLKIDNQVTPKRMTVTDGSIAAIGGIVDTTITTYRSYLRLEQEIMLRQDNSGKITDYYNWYWTNEESLNIFFNAPGYVNGTTADIYLSGRTLDVTGTVDDIGYMDLYINNVKGTNKSCNQFWCNYNSLSMISGSNSIRLDLMSNDNSAPYFDYMEIDFLSENIPQNSYFDLPLGVLEATAEIQIANNFDNNALLFDISNPKDVRLISGATANVGSLTFYANLTSSQYNRFLACSESTYNSPFSIEAVEVTDLYSYPFNKELIIITPKILIPALEEYVLYRQNGPKIISTGIYAIEDIMDNFSFGLYDPTAIRDFLKYTYENFDNPKPSSALLVGDGSYDFLNRLGNDVPNYIPPYINGYDNSSSDDNYVYFGDYGILDGDTSYVAVNADRGFDMIISRWPVRTTSEISVIVDKIKNYESEENFGEWRNNITFVSDDEFGTFVNETFHTIQTEELANNHVPDFINRNKIYLWEYPFVNSSKPAVNEQIVESINNGTIMINYVGHGNPDVWAHEHVFTRGDDLPRLTNHDKLSIFFAASCAIGFFDDPEREGMAEDLLSMNNGGAIGVISATRLVYASDNAAFNRKVYDVLLFDDSLSICEAVYTAKLQRQYLGSLPSPQKNDRNYLFFGDPFTKLAIPKYKAEFSTNLDSIIALNPTSVSGRIVDYDNNLLSYDGQININVMDSEREKSFRLLNDNGQILQTINYAVNGPTIFRGSASVNSGDFEFSFVPPLDIGFGGEGARISVYANLGDIDGAGILEPISISDSIAVINDSIGPQINISFAEINDFVSGAMIRKGDHMILTLNDNSGINLTGSLGHGISLEIDNQPEKMINLTPLFSYDQDDYTNGSLTYAIDGIEPGIHKFKIKAWDNANNSSVYYFDAEILKSGKLAINNLLNYPNPMDEYTTFSYELSSPVEKFSLDIFTLAGRKIKSFTRNSLGAGYYDDIRWYGKDFAGDRVATEVYIYKATAYPSEGGDKVESFGKIILIN